MRVIFLVLLTLMTTGAISQAGFSGTYTGKINGDPTRVEIQQSASKVTGKYIETGNTYDLQGTVVSGLLTGELIIQGSTVVLANFEATRTETGMHMELVLLGVTKVSADFMRSGQSAGTTESAINKPQKDQSQASPKDNFSRDPAVVGQWLKEEIIQSGIGDQGASFVTAYFLSFRPDGTFIQEKATGSGGSNWSMVDQKTLDVSGHWYTKDQIMYVRPTGEKEYVRLNRYLFHEGALVFKTEAGKYLIWNRR